jgi:hypothetical protein
MTIRTSTFVVFIEETENKEYDLIDHLVWR